MHTDLTLDIFDSETKRLGREFRAFVKNTCASFQTTELKRETAARHKRQLKKIIQSGQIPQAALPSTEVMESTGFPKTLNINTIKFHSLGDHADTIREFGTNDSHSTEPVCWRPLLSTFLSGS